MAAGVRYVSSWVLERVIAILTTMEANPQGLSARELAGIKV